MTITGTHVLLYTPEADALRDCLRDVFDLPHVDAGGGWLIFGLPPAEVGVHPTDGPDSPRTHAVSFTCDDIHATMAELAGRGITFTGDPVDEGWGIATTMILPGDVHVQLYEPRHPTPPPA